MGVSLDNAPEVVDSQVELSIVLQEELAAIFPTIVPGIKRVKLRDGGDVTWNEYTVFHELKLGTSELVIVTLDGDYAGFLVVTKAPTYLFVWVAYSDLTGVDIFDIALTQLEDLARDAGCNAIKFGTTRRGWEKVGKKHGFFAEEIRYSKRIYEQAR
tara:strand:+ start:9502 stop:9972 length:471 start_codon:yes stop_codon:yes gene_type:complete